jgi:hypothetical protein
MNIETYTARLFANNLEAARFLKVVNLHYVDIKKKKNIK